MADETMTLLPCPFCGHRVDNSPERPFPTTRARDCWAARCGNPYCGAEILGATPGEAATRWNRRDSAIAERKVPDGWQCIAPPCKCDDRKARWCAYAIFHLAPEVTP